MTLPSWIPQISNNNKRLRSKISWSLIGTSSIIDRVADKAVAAINLLTSNNSSSLGAPTQAIDANTRKNPKGAASVRIIKMEGIQPQPVAAVA